MTSAAAAAQRDLPAADDLFLLNYPQFIKEVYCRIAVGNDQLHPFSRMHDFCF